MKRNKRYPINYYTSGCGWIIIGICNLFDNVVADITKIALLLALFIFFMFRKDNSDMYKLKNYERTMIRAKATAATIIYCVLCVSSILIPLVAWLFDGAEWNWLRIIIYAFFVLIGIIDISIGAAFSKLIKDEGK